MKYYLDKKDEDAKSMYIVSVVRDEGTYHVTYANGDSVDMQISEDTMVMLEETLKAQFNQVLARKDDIDNGDTIDKVFHVFLLISSLKLLLDSSNDIFRVGLYSMMMLGVLGSAYIRDKKYKKSLAEFDDVDEILYRLDHKEEVVAYLKNSNSARGSFDNIETYNKLCHMIDEGIDPFSFVNEEEVDVSSELFHHLVEKSQFHKELSKHK